VAKVQSNSRIQFASNKSKLISRKFNPCLKWALICNYHNCTYNYN
jgi:hypothetical protein